MSHVHNADVLGEICCRDPSVNTGSYNMKMYTAYNVSKWTSIIDTFLHYLHV